MEGTPKDDWIELLVRELDIADCWDARDDEDDEEGDPNDEGGDTFSGVDLLSRRDDREGGREDVC